MERKRGHKIIRIFLRIVAGFIGLSLFFVLIFKWFPVPLTPLMIIRCVQQKAEGKNIMLKHDWVSMKKISQHIQLAAVSSEDQNFFVHHGFDMEALRKVVKDSKGSDKKLRGASTISQQTAKNIFLWPRRSWIRKGFEVWFTGLIELFWSKKRILEVYLNSIEMGDGIYGAESAAQSYFGITASELSKYQAASIIAVLPNPRKWSARSPGPYVQSRIDWIIGQMNMQPPLPYKIK